MTDGDALVLSPRLTLPRDELVLRATRSGGPGGQHVNTSSTRIELVWDVAASPTLDDALRAYERLSAFDPSDPEPLEQMDTLAVLLSDWDTLIAVLEKKSEMASDEENASICRRSRSSGMIRGAPLTTLPPLRRPTIP